MKARIKATGEIVYVEFTERKTHTDEVVYITQEGCLIEESRLDFNVETIDYWTRLEHQAAIAAMGGMCGNTKYNDYAWVDMAKFAIEAAHALVQKMKEEK